MMGRAWTTGEKRRLHEMRAQRIPVKQIAQELDRSVDGIYSFLRYIPATRDHPAQMSKTPRVLFQWTEFEIARVREMALQGASAKEAAEALRVSAKSVRNMACRNDIYFGVRKERGEDKCESRAKRDARQGSAMLLEALLKLAA